MNGSSNRSSRALVWLSIPALFFLGCRDRSQPLSAVRQSGALAPMTGNTPVDGEIAVLQLRLQKQAPGDAETFTQLARAFVRKARQGNDPRYYEQADDAVERALKLEPDYFSALQVRQAVLLNAHRFAEAQHLATQQIKQQPRDPISWGTLGDSALELGDYDTAMQAYQVMIDLKPDLRSYNRGAYMRWLTGDGDGAVELMQSAIDASSARESESRAFCRVELGDIFFYRGQYAQSRAQYELALRDLPGYAPAFVGRGRLLLSSGDAHAVADGLSDLAAAMKILPTTATRALYIDALHLAGRKDEAEKETAVLLREGAREDPRTTALFLAMHRQQPELALELAQQEVQRRPDIFSQDALGWAAYRNGQLELAWEAVQKATRLHTADPRLHFHLGAVALARGDRERGIKEIRTALIENPRWDVNEPAEARALLTQLGVSTP